MDSVTSNFGTSSQIKLAKLSNSGVSTEALLEKSPAQQREALQATSNSPDIYQASEPSSEADQAHLTQMQQLQQAARQHQASSLR